MSNRVDLRVDRRQFVAGLGAVAAVGLRAAPGIAAAPRLTVSGRVIEVNGRAAPVFGITGSNGQRGVLAKAGERFAGAVINDTADPLTLHWHGQIHAPFDQDRSRPGGGAIAAGGTDTHDFLLTPGTHWMHSHQLTEQQLLAAPMVTREADAGDVQDVIVMLHDFAFRSPAEILAELGGSNAHASHGAPAMPPAAAGPGSHAGHGAPADAGHAGHMGHGAGMGAVHANDIAYDAYLANDRTLADPEVVRVERNGRVRLRIINGATATAFILDTGAVTARCVAVDGSPCVPIEGRRFPLAQGQRIDLVVTMPSAGGAFPIVAQVEDMRRRTGIVLATPGASVSRLADEASAKAPFADFAFERTLRATTSLPTRRADRRFDVLMGEEPGYRWTLNGAIHGEHTPFEAKVGERVEIAFMNPTAMMHPMHLHGHHFQVVGGPGGRFIGAVRDTVIVPPRTPVVVALDCDKVGDWYLHCHHLYHMATGMMTELRVR